MGRLDNRVAFITGVARAQGRSHALRLAEEGANIIGLDSCTDVRTTPYPGATTEDLEETGRLIAKTGRKAVLRKADVRDPAAVQAVADEGVAELGRLDIVSANAGVFSMGTLVELDLEAWHDVLDINLTGVLHTVKATVPHIRAGGRGGSLILTASAIGIDPMPATGHYSAAKSGVITLMKTLAVELGPENIRVNAVAPGVVDTLMVDNEQVRRAFAPHLNNPTREESAKPGAGFFDINALPHPWVEVDDISAVVAFLASDESRYITGVTIPVDNGSLVKF
jgi:(+)-trans-carveol dehydrogenase